MGNSAGTASLEKRPLSLEEEPRTEQVTASSARKQARALREQEAQKDTDDLMLHLHRTRDWFECRVEQQRQAFREAEEQLQKLHLMTEERKKKNRELVHMLQPVESYTAEEASPSEQTVADSTELELHEIKASLDGVKMKAEKHMNEMKATLVQAEEEAVVNMTTIRTQIGRVEDKAEKHIDEMEAMIEEAEEAAGMTMAKMRAKMGRVEQKAEMKMNNLRAEMQEVKEKAETQINELKATIEQAEEETGIQMTTVMAKIGRVEEEVEKEINELRAEMERVKGKSHVLKGWRTALACVVVVVSGELCSGCVYGARLKLVHSSLAPFSHSRS